MKNTKTVIIAKHTFSALVFTSSVLLTFAQGVMAKELQGRATSSRDSVQQVADGAPRVPVSMLEKEKQNAIAKININLASYEQLVALPGIGKVKATAIIRYRKEVGMFKVLEDLQNIKGIGTKLFAKLSDKIKI